MKPGREGDRLPVWAVKKKVSRKCRVWTEGSKEWEEGVEERERGRRLPPSPLAATVAAEKGKRNKEEEEKEGRCRGKNGREERREYRSRVSEGITKLPSVYIYSLFQFNSHILANCETKL